MLEYSRSRVLLRFANSDRNIWQCGRRATHKAEQASAPGNSVRYQQARERSVRAHDAFCPSTRRIRAGTVPTKRVPTLTTSLRAESPATPHRHWRKLAAVVLVLAALGLPIN